MSIKKADRLESETDISYSPHRNAKCAHVFFAEHSSATCTAVPRLHKNPPCRHCSSKILSNETYFRVRKMPTPKLSEKIGHKLLQFNKQMETVEEAKRPLDTADSLSRIVVNVEGRLSCMNISHISNIPEISHISEHKVEPIPLWEKLVGKLMER